MGRYFRRLLPFAALGVALASSACAPDAYEGTEDVPPFSGSDGGTDDGGDDDAGNSDDGGGGDSTDGSCNDPGGCWTAMAPMQSPRYIHASGEVGGKVYLIGGNGNFAYLGSVVEFDPTANSWTNCGAASPSNACAAMSSARGGMAAGEVGGTIYIFGGNDPSGILDTVEQYDPSANAWINCGNPAPGNACSPMPTARTDFSGAVVNGKVYLVGGNIAPSTPSDIVEEYDPTTNTWTNCGTAEPGNGCAAMPSARYETAVTTINGVIYVFGGFDGSGAVDTVEAYDPVANSWTAKAAMPTARWGPSSGLAAGRIYVIGGSASPNLQFTADNTVEEYDPTADNWTNCGPSAPGNSCTQAPFDHGYASSAVVSDAIFVMGGTPGDSIGLMAIERYTPPAP